MIQMPQEAQPPMKVQTANHPLNSLPTSNQWHKNSDISSD